MVNAFSSFTYSSIHLFIFFTMRVDTLHAKAECVYEQDSVGRYRNTINKAVDYIVRNIEGLNDTYALSLCAYALNLAKHPYETPAFNFLESRAVTMRESKWWSKAIPKDDKNPHYSLPRSVDVEMTSYGLLLYLRRNYVVEAIPVMKWLIKQRNTEGGFASTQVSGIA
jgi:CD109 antigen